MLTEKTLYLLEQVIVLQVTSLEMLVWTVTKKKAISIPSHFWNTIIIIITLSSL